MTTFSLSEDANGKSLAIFFDNGDTETIPESHISFKTIVDKWFKGDVVDAEIRELTYVLQTIVTKMTALSERVSVNNGELYFDGDPMSGELAEHIKSAFKNGRSLDFQPLVNFLEKASTNPQLKSIDNLYRWVSNGDLIIAPDGDFLAYKGTRLMDGTPHSIWAGTAFVNGEEITGHIPNVPGSIISMPRSKVVDDENKGCAPGLHAGTFNYATGHAEYLLLVKINPRDVVSVPRDSSSQKLRVSRYTVLEHIKGRVEEKYFQPELPLDIPEEEPAKVTVPTPAPTGTGPVRDEKGRFIKGAKVPRDEKGRFIK